MMSDGGLYPVGASVEDTNGNPNNPNPSKRKRNLPGAPDPNSEVIALSPKSLMATNRFICEVCNKGFQREQNLQLHRRGHNLPWKLKQKSNIEIVRRKVYVCPEKTCVHNDPSRALGDLTGIKKHYSRKHGEKRWKCHKCSKKYAVLSDLKAHAKICGTREYKCDCGTIFSRKDSFITHRAFCDALAQQNGRFTTTPVPSSANLNLMRNHEMMNNGKSQFSALMFKPEDGGGLGSRNNDIHALNPDLPKLSRFPLWLDSANSHHLNTMSNNINPIGSNVPRLFSSNSNNYNLASSSTSLPQLEQMSSQQNQWFSARAGLLKEEENDTGNLYDAAAALSQKTGQMGSSSSPIFDTGTFGLMNTFPNMAGCSFNSLNNQSRNELFHHQNLGKSDQDFSALMASTTASALATNGRDRDALWFSSTSDMINSNPLLGSSRNFDPLLIANSSSEIGGRNELTRDFLGVGGASDQNRHFLQENHELMTKFASNMDSAMNLNHYMR